MILERRKKRNVIISGPAGKGGVQGGMTEMIFDLDIEGQVGINPLWFQATCMNVS